MAMTVQPNDLTCLGVVPVFVNVGAVALPAIIGALTSVLGILLKPKELMRVCKARPYVPVLVVAGGVGLFFGITWLMEPPAAPQRTKTAVAKDTVDWTQVAMVIIEQEARAKENGGTKPPTPQTPSGSQPQVKPAATPPIATEAVGQPQAMYYRGGPSRSGYAGGKAPLGLTSLWSFTGADGMYLSSPLVVGDAVYSGSCLLDPPNNFGAVFCLDAATGKVRWTTDEYTDPDTGKKKECKGFFSSAAVTADGKYLVIGQGLHLDANCALLCLDAQSGRVRWVVKTPLHIEGSPAIEGDIVVAGAGAIEVGNDHHAQGNPGYVLAVRISDGKKLWEYQVNDPESSPVIRDGVVYIGSGLNGSAAVALRLESTDDELKAKGLDRLIWKVPTPFPALGPVTVVDDLVLFGCGNGDFVFAAPNPEGVVLALDRATGQTRWQTTVADTILGAIAVCGDRAYCPIRNGEVIALDLKASGGAQVLWRQRISGKTPVLASPACTGDYVYAVSQDGYLAVLDAKDGKVLEKIYINAKGKPGEMGLSTSSPFVAGGRLYVGSETGGLRCYTGKESQ